MEPEHIDERPPSSQPLPGIIQPYMLTQSQSTRPREKSEGYLYGHIGDPPVSSPSQQSNSHEHKRLDSFSIDTTHPGQTQDSVNTNGSHAVRQGVSTSGPNSDATRRTARTVPHSNSDGVSNGRSTASNSNDQEVDPVEPSMIPMLVQRLNRAMAMLPPVAPGQDAENPPEYQNTPP